MTQYQHKKVSKLRKSLGWKICFLTNVSKNLMDDMVEKLNILESYGQNGWKFNVGGNSRDENLMDENLTE